jgi:surface carbohydrate biosynthesis protein (TIGR04326 family)
VDHCEATGRKPLVLTMVLEQPRQQLKKLSLVDSTVPVLPIDSCLTLGDIFRCAFSAIKMYVRLPKLNGTAEIDGVDFSFLVNRAIWDANHTGNSFMSLRLYYAARWLARRVRLERCFYVYENLPWERMLVLGIRSVSPRTRMLGYQHASVTSSHTNLMLAESESNVAPFPDAVLTTGEVVKDWLQREGNYPTGVIKAACALRQGQPSHLVAKQRSRGLNHILVALATSQVEYTKSLLFLLRAFEGTNEYQLRIRPHPSIPIEPAIVAVPIGSNQMLSISEGPLSEDLEWADAVIYSSSTVGMEGVATGIPAICIDLGEHLDTDPMFGWNRFKWPAKDPQTLISVIEQVNNIPDPEFEVLQLQGQEYVASYLSPVTKDGLNIFLEA